MRDDGVRAALQAPTGGLEPPAEIDLLVEEEEARVEYGEVSPWFKPIVTYELKGRPKVVETTLSFTRATEPGWELGEGGWVVLAVLLILGTTNAVNLTDGLDGLAAGSSIYAFLTMTVVAFWAFRHLAVVAAAMVGGITGVLWWNAPPAQVFMGDTGALAIGAGLAVLALTLNVQLLLPIVGALFVFETLSVIVQVGSFRLTGRRVFRMAPVHHHFELGGWPETTVIIRFWILAIMSMAVALGLFYADSISAGVAG